MPEDTKPVPITWRVLDYLACSKWLQKKYNYDERNYAGHRHDITDTDPANPPYQDFWHWIVHNHQIMNGCILRFSRSSLKEAHFAEADWVKKIYTYYLDEFADEHGVVVFHVWW